jgi:hypothetical protein
LQHLKGRKAHTVNCTYGTVLVSPRKEKNAVIVIAARYSSTFARVRVSQNQESKKALLSVVIIPVKFLKI